jgi:hypothetical protein
MELKTGDLLEMKSNYGGGHGLFLLIKLDTAGDPVVQVLRPRPSSSDYVGEVAAFYADALRHVVGER